MTSELDALNESSAEVDIGDGLSFEAFYHQQRRSLIALAYTVSGSRTAAEDLAQEALVIAYESWDEIRSKDNPGTWVRRILLNRASSTYRRHLAELRALAKRPFSNEPVVMPEVTGELDQLLKEIRRLPRRQVEVIALASVEGLSIVEIAELLEISKESVNTHMRRARQTLARRLRLEDTR